MKKTKIVKAAKALIRNRQGKILFLKEKTPSGKSTYYGFPGGRLEKGESARQALVREVWEETGLKVKPARKISEYQVLRENGTLIQLQIFYCIIEGKAKTRVQEKQKQKKLGENIQSIHWLSLNQVFKRKLPLVSESFREFLASFKK